jgi:nucleoid-associated protein YgaU
MDMAEFSAWRFLIMKNRAGWLALGVLAIATILMVFFVLPHIRGTNQTAEKPLAPVQKPQTAAAKPETIVADDQVASGKMKRLSSEAEKSVAALEALFADQKIPKADVYASSRLAAMTALKALAEMDIPTTVEANMADSMTKAKAMAAKALLLLTKLPSSPEEAAGMIVNIGRALHGEPELAAKDDGKPKFDVLRVEKDGSTVIAGNAAPGTKLDVMDGDKTISTTTVSPNGDFAIVLDKPLQAGDHTLDLQSTGKDGKVVKSQEQATISVPDNQSGDVLAMVSKPGEASRLMTVPKGVAEGNNEQVNADKQGRIPAQTADASPAQSAQPSSANSANAPTEQLQITAVELEGYKIFVAGTAPKNSSVTAYADGKQIGSSDVDAKGHFVVEGQMAISVGQHIISVDLKDANGKVTLRASVPFNRPAGDQVSVVAPEKLAESTGGPGSPASVDSNLFDRQRDTLAKSFALLSNLFADGKTPSLESLAASRSALEFALKAVADFRPTPSTNAGDTSFMLRMAENARKAQDALKKVEPASVKSMASALPDLEKLVQATLEPMQNAAQLAVAKTETPTDPSAPPTISQEPLQASNNTVIIRRGDTLWQISRRVYGQGVRYTTIYMANAEQITNPDLIEPGQTFTVPDKALPESEAEAIHRKWMHRHKP